MAKGISRRREVIAIVDMIERKMSMKDIARILAAYLVENRATRQTDLYLRDIRSELESRFAYVVADIKTAKKLSDKLEKQLAQLIKTEMNAKNVEIIKTVDESLVGGVVISTTDAELDASIRSKLQKLRSI